MALADAAHAVFTDSTGPLKPNALASVSATACGETSSSSSLGASTPFSRRRYHSSPASRPALQEPMTTPQRSAGIFPDSATPHWPTASSEAFSAKSITGSR